MVRKNVILTQLKPFKPEDMLIGVAVDNYKQKAYKKAIKAAGFTIESVEWMKAGFTLIKVETAESRKDELEKLLKQLELKHSLRNRMN